MREAQRPKTWGIIYSRLPDSRLGKLEGGKTRAITLASPLPHRVFDSQISEPRSVGSRAAAAAAAEVETTCGS